MPATLIAVFLATAAGISAQHATTHPATPAGARAFLAEVDRELLRLINAASRAGWTQSTYITTDTETMAAQANEALVSASTRYAKEAVRFDKVQVTPVSTGQRSRAINAPGARTRGSDMGGTPAGVDVPRSR